MDKTKVPGSQPDSPGPKGLEPGRRLGRPPGMQSAEIDQAILLAAKDLFLSIGYEATSMAAVAQASGVSKRTLYARHPTKEHLMQSVVADRVGKWSDEASSRNQVMPERFADRLKHHAQTLMHSLANPEVVQFDRLILATANRFPEIARTFYEVGYSYELQFLTDEIVQGTKDDAVPAQRPRQIAHQLLSMIQGWRRIEETRRTIDAEEADRFAADAVDVLLRGRDGW